MDTPSHPPKYMLQIKQAPCNLKERGRLGNSIMDRCLDIARQKKNVHLQESVPSSGEGVRHGAGGLV